MQKQITSLVAALALTGCGHVATPTATALKTVKPAAAKGQVTAKALPGFEGTASGSLTVKFDAAGRALLAASPLQKVIIEMHQGGPDGPVAARVEVTRDQALNGEVTVHFQGMQAGAYTALLRSKDALDMLLRVVAWAVRLVEGQDMPIQPAPMPKPAPSAMPDEQAPKPQPIETAAPVGTPAPVDQPAPSGNGNIRRVKAGDDLQAAINAAQPGDTLVLDAGATFTGAYTLPVKAGDAYVTITSSGADTLGSDRRVAPADAAKMAKIVSSGKGESAFATKGAAHHYRLVGLEVTALPGELVYDLVRLGANGADQNTLAQVPHHITIDRCYLHAADDATGLKRGVQLNSADTAVTNSYLAGFKAEGQDSQAVAGFNGPGPFKIVNNHLEGAGENIIFGGSDPSIPNLVPSDIEIRRNEVVKPLAWKGGKWSVKNLFELKNARRVVVEGNVFENNWGNAQVGFAIVLTPRNQDGTAPWSCVEDVDFKNNIVRHTASAMNILGNDNINHSQPTKGVHVYNNLFDDVDGKAWNGGGIFLQLGEGGSGVVVDHNTAFHTGNTAGLYGAVTPGVVFTNNLLAANEYGMHGDGRGGGTDSINTFWPNATVQGNLIGGAPEKSYPAGNFYPAGQDAAQFLDRANHNYRLQAASPYARKGTDGKDVGVDFDQLNAATGLGDQIVD